jgi:hypothetical protein
MPNRTITTSTGTTVAIVTEGDLELIVLDHPDAPADMRNTEAGQLIDGGFQPVPFAAFGLTPPTLRAIADLIEGVEHA